MVYLGIDYGKRKVGLSISEGQFAAPLFKIEIKSLPDALGKVAKVVKDYQVDQVIVGMPESGEAKHITKKFITGLKKNNIEVLEAEETLSTYSANQYLKTQGKKSVDEDALAAAIILQNYLDSLN